MQFWLWYRQAKKHQQVPLVLELFTSFYIQPICFCGSKLLKAGIRDTLTEAANKWLMQPETTQGALSSPTVLDLCAGDGVGENQELSPAFSNAFWGASTPRESGLVQKHCWILPLIHSVTAPGPASDNISRGTEEINNFFYTVWRGVPILAREYYKSRSIWCNIKKCSMNEPFPSILIVEDNVLENIGIEFSGFSGWVSGCVLIRDNKIPELHGLQCIMKVVLSIVGSNDLSVQLERGGFDYCSILCDIDRDIHTGEL